MQLYSGSILTNVLLGEFEVKLSKSCETKINARKFQLHFLARKENCFIVKVKSLNLVEIRSFGDLTNELHE